MDPRYNRLCKDYEKLQELASRSRFISIQGTEGSPPEKYVLHLTCKGITRIGPGDKPVYSRSHQLGIYLHPEYPRKGPVCQMLTPVYHPNIAGNGLVCYGDEGDHGWAPSMGLDDLVIRIVQIIRYENLNPNSTWNGDTANWARTHAHLFPLETSQIVSEELIDINILDSTENDLDIRIF
jgi:ubiquitin-protein ligase